MKLAIVGSSILTEGQSEVAEWLIDCLIERFKPTTIISGGAQGIDFLAAKAAGSRSIELIEYLPKYPTWHGRNSELTGYKHRNTLIAEACDELVSIRSIHSKTYGSGWTGDYTEGLGKKVWRLYV